MSSISKEVVASSNVYSEEERIYSRFSDYGYVRVEAGRMWRGVWRSEWENKEEDD